MSTTRDVGIVCTIMVLLGSTVMNVISLQTADAMTSGYNATPPYTGTITHPTLPPSNETIPGGSTSSSGGTTTPPRLAAVDYFLKIDGIDGESQVGGITGADAAVGWSWGAINPNVPNLQSVIDSGDPHGSFHFTMKTSKASPQLMLACATGSHIKSVELLGAADMGQGQQIFLTLPLDDVLVSSYQVSGNSDKIPMEEISLNFAKIEMSKWDPQVLQNLANNRMANAIELKTNMQASGSLTAPTQIPTTGTYNYYLTTGAGQGGTAVSGQPNEIQIDSWSFGVTDDNGKVSMQDFLLVPHDGSSITETTFPAAKLIIQQAGDPTPLLSFSFEKASISSFITVTPPDGIDYKFSQIVMEHEGSPVKAGWNLQTHAPISSLAPNVQGHHVPANKIPVWLHNNAKFWAKGQISDLDFEAGIKYLIDNQVIKLNAAQSQENSSQSEIPIWVKHNADWWSQGLISDDEFLKSLEYMVNHGIIKLNKAALMAVTKMGGL